ncbi:uncharacterized protein LOC134206736 [Armigeres subalbatus]|uniref:uncharacterized protein LOC134206736 n=1 Tax=Armigeres subalbatus TaxID=124917 RepID=UPI002ECFDDF4
MVARGSIMSCYITQTKTKERRTQRLKNTDKSDRERVHHGTIATLIALAPASLCSVIFQLLLMERMETSNLCILDEGSKLTLMDEDLADELGLDGIENPLYLRWTGGTERCEEGSCTTTVSIAGTYSGARRFELNEVRTVKELQLPTQSLDAENMKKQFPHLRGLPIESYKCARPRILIGLKHAHVSLVLQSREGRHEQPIAIKTRLGWTVCGGSDAENAPNMVHYSFHVGMREGSTDEDLHQAMKEYFALDSLGVTKSSEALLSSEDQRSCRLLESLTKFNGERYETGLLWRYDDIRLPDSRPMALRRHRLLEKRLRKDPDLEKIMNQKIKEYLEKGYIRKLPKEEDVRSTSRPDQLCSLFAILLQFREHCIGLTGDIREMYHQVVIRDQDCPCQRFFWKDDTGEVAVFEMRVMTFGACCSPSSAQFVKNINAERFTEKYPKAVDTIIKRHYVDDMLVSVETEEEAILLAHQVKYVHSHGGFEIRNWISNSPAVLKSLGEIDTKTKNLDVSAELATEKVLGLWWCTQKDTFTFKIGWTRYDEALLTGRRRPSKREVLKVLMTIFDPLAHRVSELLDTTEAREWRWVPTKYNVADDATKWQGRPDLTVGSRWFTGPRFLRQPEAEWPQQTQVHKATREELRTHLVAHISPVSPAIPITDYSNWRRLIKVIGFILRFPDNCRRRIQGQAITNGPLRTEELRAAENSIFRLVQRESYAAEISILTQGKQIPQNSQLYKSTPFLDDDGVLRMRGRTSGCAFISEEAKNPIILPRDHHVTTLIIAHYHAKYHHLNQETVVNELRQKYVISRIRVCCAKTCLPQG